jgi:molybdenum cofactor cytidylyltransferase
MPSPDRPFASGLVLAAGESKRLGQPKQLLPYRGATLLEHVLELARQCPFDQRICVVGPELPGIDFTGLEVVENRAQSGGCSSSIAAALRALDPRCDVLVLLLGDQPGVESCIVAELIAGQGAAPLAACAYADGRGHPLAFARPMFAELAALHGDKGVWKLLDRHAADVAEIPVAGPIPRDVDTWEDYEAVLAS